MLRKLAVLVTSAIVLAATQPRVEAQTPAVPDWSGFYAGLAVGGRWADNTWNTTNVAPTLAAILSTDPNPTASFDSAAARFAAYFGYNWLFAPAWIAGIEADIGRADNSKNRNRIPGTVQNDITVPFAYINQPQGIVKESRDASLRARLGKLVSVDMLLFATAGAAWQHLELSGNCPTAGGATDWCTLLHNETHSTTRLGWTLGGGVERIAGGWIVRTEYRYADFGTFTRTFFTLDPGVPFDDRLTAHVKVRTHTASVGIARKFGADRAAGGIAVPAGGRAGEDGAAGRLRPSSHIVKQRSPAGRIPHSLRRI